LRELTISTADSGPQQLNLNSPTAPLRSLPPRSSRRPRPRQNFSLGRSEKRPTPIPLTSTAFYDLNLGLHSNAAIGLAQVADAHGDPMIFIRPTRIGDLNLDGTVSIATSSPRRSLQPKRPRHHLAGRRLNYDGSVSIADFIDLAANFNSNYAG